ncbi:MAG: PAS domain S-box protein [Dehalococcoidia bacterium]|nr:PAS domain S-box protein [Dehalococcoidia bacterium]
MKTETSTEGSDGRFRDLIKLIPAIICELAPDGTTLFVNEAVYNVTGYRPGELVGRNWWDMLYPLAQNGGVDPCQRSRLGDVTNQETILVAKDGSFRNLVWTSFNEYFSDGRLKNVIGFGIDYADHSQAEGLFRAMVGSTPLGSYIVQQGRFQFASEPFQKHTGYSELELLGTDPLDLVLPEDKCLVRANAVGMLKGEISSPYEFRVVCKGGEIRWIMETVASIEYRGKRATLGNFMDITDRKRAERALEHSEKRFRLLFEKSPMGIVILRYFTLLYANPTCQSMFGYEDLLEPKAESVLDYFAPRERQDVAERVNAEEQEGSQSAEFESVGQRRDGTQFPIHVVITHMALPDGPAAVVFFTDITERKQAEETIKQMAYRDPLTGLPNRALFDDRLNVALAQARRHQQMLAVSMMDLDQFKRVNDTLGHDVGDRLLKGIAERLTGLLRSSDTVARMGGDEFMFVFSGLGNAEQAVEIAERTLTALRQPFSFDHLQLSISASIGIAIFPDDGEDAETLTKNADVAMYRTKERGRDGFQRYSPRMRAAKLD